MARQALDDFPRARRWCNPLLPPCFPRSGSGAGNRARFRAAGRWPTARARDPASRMCRPSRRSRQCPSYPGSKAALRPRCSGWETLDVAAQTLRAVAVEPGFGNAPQNALDQAVAQTAHIGVARFHGFHRQLDGLAHAHDGGPRFPYRRAGSFPCRAAVDQPLQLHARANVQRAYALGGAWNLWPERESRSIPSAFTSMGTQPMACTASVWKSAPCALANLAASRMGLDGADFVVGGHDGNPGSYPAAALFPALPG